MQDSGKTGDSGVESAPETALRVRTRRRETRQRIVSARGASVTPLAQVRYFGGFAFLVEPIHCSVCDRSRSSLRSSPLSQTRSRSMSCLSKIGCLTVVVAAGIGGWWLYGGRMPSTFATAGRTTFGGAATADSSTGAVAWSTMRDAKMRSGDALSTLNSPSGPAYITLGAGDLAGFLADGFERVLPQSAADVQVAIIDDVLRVRSEVPLRELGGKALPEFVTDMLSARDTVEMAGKLEMIHPGLAQLRVNEVIVRGIPLPPRVVPPLLNALRKSTPQGDSIAADAIAIPLPKSVSDVRVSRGRVTLYKSTSTK
jgi:hypothetical protein